MAESLLKVVMPAAMFFIMMSMGLELTRDDFRRVFTQPRAVLSGVIGQLVFLKCFHKICFFRTPRKMIVRFRHWGGSPGEKLPNVFCFMSYCWVSQWWDRCQGDFSPWWAGECE